jgi:hypothetical protein
MEDFKMLSELFQNKLFLQYLSGLGSGIAQDKSVAGTLDEITQQNISAQSQAGLIGLFKKMLGGEVPEGGKLTMDSKGMKMDMPKASFMSQSLEGETGGMGAPREGATLDPGKYSLGVPTPNVPTPTMPNLPTQQEGGALSKLLNPSGSQPGISASDLAGLTPENVSAALAGALNIEGLSQKKMTDMVDMIYKGALTGQARARTVDILEGDPLDQQFPINMPGVGPVTLREWQSLPMDDREYAAYVHTAKQLGDADIMSKEDFVNTFEITEKEQFLRAAMGDEDLMAAEIKLRTAGATQINVGERAFDTARARQQAFVMGPDFESNIEQDLRKDGRAWRATSESEKLSKSRGISFEEARGFIQKKKVLQEMDKQIRAAFTGKTVERRIDGWYIDGKLIRRNPYYGG